MSPSTGDANRPLTDRLLGDSTVSGAHLGAVIPWLLVYVCCLSSFAEGSLVWGLAFIPLLLSVTAWWVAVWRWTIRNDRRD